MSAPEEKIYDLIVVGAGMIGSAAAHHASQIPNTTVCLVGPPEPKVRKGQDIFGCWFDEGWLCYQINRNKIWCNLGAKSLARFRDLEKLTGVKFYTESGYAYVTLDKSILENLMEVNQKCGFEAQDITNSWKNIFPFLHLPDDASVVWQNVKWDVVTECGSVLQGHRVLVAAGGFAALKPLFHHVAPQMVPDLELRTQTISYLCISAEEAQRLKLMPSLIINAPHGNIDGVYVVPPIKYPDGLKVEKVSGDGCLTSHTPTSHPYIDTVTDGFGVALGGNGCAAKACDEVGRLAARLVVLGEWESEVPKECLKIIWKSSQL